MKRRSSLFPRIASFTFVIVVLAAFSPGGPNYKWESLQHDFGKIKKGKPVSQTFSFRNSGDAPLLITEAKSGCGCTVAEFTKEVIAPGADGFVKVTFNAAKEGAFSKNVLVTSNVKGTPATIQITGIVEE